MSTGVVDLHISDHQPVYLVRKKDRDNRPKVCFRGRSYRNYSKELLSDSLTHEIKEKFRQVTDSNACWDMITHYIISLSKDRDSAWARAKLTNNDDDWAVARRLKNWANNSVKDRHG